MAAAVPPAPWRRAPTTFAFSTSAEADAAATSASDTEAQAEAAAEEAVAAEAALAAAQAAEVGARWAAEVGGSGAVSADAFTGGGEVAKAERELANARSRVAAATPISPPPKGAPRRSRRRRRPSAAGGSGRAGLRRCARVSLKSSGERRRWQRRARAAGARSMSCSRHGRSSGASRRRRCCRGPSSVCPASHASAPPAASSPLTTTAGTTRCCEMWQRGGWRPSLMRRCTRWRRGWCGRQRPDRCSQILKRNALTPISHVSRRAGAAVRAALLVRDFVLRAVFLGAPRGALCVFARRRRHRRRRRRHRRRWRRHRRRWWHTRQLVAARRTAALRRDDRPRLALASRAFALAIRSPALVDARERRGRRAWRRGGGAGGSGNAGGVGGSAGGAGGPGMHRTPASSPCQHGDAFDLGHSTRSASPPVHCMPEKRIGPVPIPYSAQQSAATAPAKPRWRHTTCASSMSQSSSHTCGGAGWGGQPCACAA